MPSEVVNVSIYPDGSDRREGPTYRITDEERERFQRDGYVVLRGVLTEEEVQSLEDVYDKFMRQEIFVPGKDFCDVNSFNRTPEEYSIVNAMLPRKYYPDWQGNIYELRTQSIVDQLCGNDMQIDYDQLLAKRPHKDDAIFPWHQDSAYWPPFESDTTTATFWLAVDESTVENGCMRFIPGSHTSELRSHRPLLPAGSTSREEAHALVCDVDDGEEGVELSKYVPIKKGDITIHNEKVVHGSGPNLSDGWRRAYVIAYRKAECITEERNMGFTHSHNDENNWDVFHKWTTNTNNPHFIGNKYKDI
jgi:ectoine hydroxylase-related dioxygenase (phytanoyl-CoA dioxygenase family)